MADRLVDQAMNGEVNEDGEPQNGRSGASVAGTPSVSGHSASGATNGAGGLSSDPQHHQNDEDPKDGITRAASTSSSSRNATERKVGVANETYFRPGPMNILPLRRLFIERQVQPEMLSFVNTEEVLDLFNMCVSSLFALLSFFSTTGCRDSLRGNEH